METRVRNITLIASNVSVNKVENGLFRLSKKNQHLFKVYA